jgi:hypothetical protein
VTVSALGRGPALASSNVFWNFELQALRPVLRRRRIGGRLPLHGERVGVRGYGLSMELNPSPGSHLSMRSDLSLRER